jgi:RHS repeat-associated protein
MVYRRGLLKSIKQPAIVDAAGNPIQYETLFDYDAAGNVTKSTTQTVVTAPAVPVVISESTFVYDSLGDVVQKIDGANVVAERVVTESIYDALGRLRETGFADANAAIDPIDGFTSRFKYDKSGRVRESTDPLGRVTRFEYDRQGNVVKQINADGTELLHEYDAFGNRIATIDPLKRTTRFVYDSRNRLVQTVHPDGAVERLRYDGVGNVVAKIDALGNVTTFKYDAAGRFVETKLTDPDGPLNDDGEANLTEPTTTNKYDKLGNLIETIDPEFNVTQFKYDKLQRVVESRTIDGREFSTLSVPQKTAIRNSGAPYVPTLGYNPVALMTTDYDAVGNVKQTVVYDTTALGSIPADPRSLITAQNVADNKVQVVAMRYDAFGRLVKTINADDTTTSMTYDAAGRVKEQKDELSRATLFEYDQFGRLTKTTLPDPDGSGTAYVSPVTSHRYDAAGNRIATIDPRGFTTRFEYDSFNRLTATVDAQGNRTRTVYDIAGQMVAAVDALGLAAYTKYDNRGRIVQQRGADPDGPGTGVAPVTRSLYDAAGRVVTKIDPLGYETNYQYDRLGRLIKESYAADYQIVDDGDPTFAFSGASALTSQPADYNGDSRLVSANGSVATVVWQFNGLEKGATYRVLASWTANSSAATDLVFRLTDFYHDPTPNNGTDDGVVAFWPEDVLLPGPNQRQATAGVLRFENGVASGWTELHAGFTINSSPNSPGSLAIHFASSQAIHADAIRIERIASRSYQYDANGNLLKEIDPLGRETTYAYDELDRVVTETLPDPDGPNNVDGDLNLIAPLTTTKYDGYGNVASVLERRGNGVNQRTTKYAYDSRNRRIEEIFDAGVDGTTNYLNRKTTFDYDDVGNLERRLEYAENAANPNTFDLLRTTSYQYDKLDRQTRETFNTDGDDNVTTPVERVTTTSYDANGNVSGTVENANTSAALTTFFAYDSLNRVSSETAVDLPISSSSVRITRFQYDAVGQQIAVINPLLRVGRSQFDRLGRVVMSTDPDPDGAGPLESHRTLFIYDAAGQLLLKNNGANYAPGSHEINRYAYDPQGRLVRSEDGRGDVTRRVYDAAGNLVKLIDPAGNATTYAYDGLDRKISETTAGVPRQFFYDGNGNLLYSVDRNGRAIKSAYTRDDQVWATWEYLDLTQAQLPAPGSQQFIAFTNSYYDAFGRLEEERYARRNDYSQASGLEYRATDSYKYDGLDRLIEHSNQSIQTTNPLHSTGVPALKQTYAYAYDSSGLVETREQFIAGQFAASTKSTYNAFGELIRQEDKETNAASAPSSIIDFESTDAAFAYLADGSLASTTRYTDWDASLGGHRNRVKTTYAYDGAGRIKNIAHSQARRTTATWPGVDTNLVDFAYGYDLADRINSQGTNWNQTLAAFASRTDETQSFTFDAAGQLLSAESNIANRDSTYAYGANGNRTSVTEPGAGTAIYAPPGANNRVSQDSTYRYVYDFEGNLTERRLVAGDVLDQTYAWDHRNRLTKVEWYVDATLAETVIYRYNAGDDLIYRSVTPAGQSSQVEHYLVESGERTMTFETDGDVLYRYQYGPTGEAIFDQSFSGYSNPTLQSEADLRLPLGDHQHSTRVVMGHHRLADDSVYIRQSVDYDPFGRVRTVVRENAQSPLPLPIDDLDTVFAHHGSIIDPSVELYLKGERWYSPDLGRFVSEDPIQDGSNWYAFAGNDPVNSADPSGLSQQGHPLNGGYSGNATRGPTIGSGNIPANNLFGGPALSPSLNNFIKGAVNQSLNPVRIPSTTFGGFVDADRGRQILGMPPAPKTVAPLPTPVQQFHRSLSNSSSLLTLTRTVDPLQSFVSQTQETRAYWRQVEINRHTVVKSEAFGGGWAGAEALAMGEQYERDALRSPTLAGYFGNKAASLGLNAAGFIANTVLGYSTPGQHVTYGDGRTTMRLGGPDTASLANQASFFGPMVLSGASRAAAAEKTVETVVRTNAQLVDDVGTRAGEWAQRSRQQTTLANVSPRTVGIKQHTYAKKVLDRYQRMFGDRGLQTEVSVIGGREVSYGSAGSVRLDVIEGSVRNPTAIYDYKFGAAGLTQKQINKIQNVGGYHNVPIIEVRP